LKFASKKDGIETTILDEGNELSRGNSRRKKLLVL
jgi:ABC-type transport system involved in cytochrome bd biosynthesis fused ATPase/permease subunit